MPGPRSGAAGLCGASQPGGPALGCDRPPGARGNGGRGGYPPAGGSGPLWFPAGRSGPLCLSIGGNEPLGFPGGRSGPLRFPGGGISTCAPLTINPGGGRKAPDGPAGGGAPRLACSCGAPQRGQRSATSGKPQFQQRVMLCLRQRALALGALARPRFPRCRESLSACQPSTFWQENAAIIAD